MHSSPFIRQGFGRISTTSEKFSPRKGLTFFANNKSQGNDEGSMNSMERNRILNYTYRSLDSEQNEYDISKNIEDVEDCEHFEDFDDVRMLMSLMIRRMLMSWMMLKVYTIIV